MDHEALQQSLLGIASAGNFAYLRIPAAEIRHWVDAAFPTFAKNAAADIVSGHAHRWVAGHDLLLDVPNTFVHEGIIPGIKHAGHILFTDFPTKSGIPIPGFSKSGLGEFLVSHGVPAEYLNINIVDGTVGLFACSEGFCDLMLVCAEHARMTPQLFFDTFVQGCAELALGWHTQNPLLLLAGGEQVFAGMVSTVYTITHPLWYVDPSVFWGASLTSGLLGFVISKFIFHRSVKESLQNAVRSCAVSGLFAIETGFGLAALCGFVGMGIGKLIADRDNKQAIRWCKVSKEDLDRIVDKYAKAYPRLFQIGNKKVPHIEFPLEPSWQLPFGVRCWGLQIVSDTKQSFGIELTMDSIPLLEFKQLSWNLEFSGRTDNSFGINFH